MNHLIRFNPLGDITRFDPLMNVEDLFDRFARTTMHPSWRELESAEPQIRMDVSEVSGEYVVKADIPGVKKDDIHVSIDGNMVTISAEIKHEMEADEGCMMLRSERSCGKALRSFRLDQEVNEDQVRARYSDGVLELTLPKKNGFHKEVAIS